MQASFYNTHQNWVPSHPAEPSNHTPGYTPTHQEEPTGENNYTPSCAPPTPAKSAARKALTRIFWRGAGAIALALSLLAQPASATTPPPPTTNPAISMSQVLPSVGAPASSHYFAATGKTVQNDFLQTFNHYGLQAIGYPLSNELQENGQVVQYFERVRMERHSDLASKGYGVLMTRLGDALSKPNQPFSTPSSISQSSILINLTNHTLSEPFLSFWKTRGGVDLFGYPISQPMSQDGMTVQWFERARFEYHPDLQSKGQPIQLTLLGKAAYEKTAAHTVSLKQQVPSVQANQAPSVQAQAPQTSLSDMETYMLKAVNEQRAAAGLRPVQLNNELIDVARTRSNDMAAHNYFSHTTPEGTNFLTMLNTRHFPYKYAGEILARNNYADNEAVSTAMASYLNSPPHKAIIMDGRYNLAGVGYTKSDQDQMHYFALIFAQQ